MQITELTENTNMWQAIVAAQEQATVARAKGLHLSTITNDIAATLYPKEFWYLKREPGAGEAFDDRTRATFEAGHVIEDAIAATLQTRIGWNKPQPRQSAEGIWCSADGWSQHTATIDEMKATWKSSRDFVGSPKWQLYLWQVMAYMHVWEARRARIHVVHMNGDWRPPRPAPPKTYIVRPTAAEIRGNWAMCVQHAKDRGWLPTSKS